MIGKNRVPFARTASVKRLLSVVAILLSFWAASCRGKAPEVERRLENGVEVVINHLTAERLRKAAHPLRLDELFVIDTERADLAKAGLDKIWGFDVNSRNEVFIFRSPLYSGNLIFRFDPGGRLEGSFGPRGEGPGELGIPISQMVEANDEISVPDSAKRKIFVFDREGRLRKEIPIKPRLRPTSDLLIPLRPDRFLFRRVEFDPSAPNAKVVYIYSVVDRDYSEVKELERLLFEPLERTSRFRYPIGFIRWAVSGDKIFLAREDHGCEIRSYDFKGNRLRNVRIEAPPIKYPDRLKREALRALEAPSLALFKAKIEFADPAPPFQHFWADDEGRMYLMTYEEGPGPGEFQVDIFDNRGAFIGRSAMNIHLTETLDTSWHYDSYTTMKNGRLYCLREKENGYLELVAYRVSWNN